LADYLGVLSDKGNYFLYSFLGSFLGSLQGGLDLMGVEIHLRVNERQW
jgi:hypothetical protein